MRVFVLCTGRSGSSTFIRACQHIENFSAAHESFAGQIGPGRLAFPENHIEADNHLIWFFGELEDRYRDEPLYVHLTRDPELVTESYLERWNRLGRDMTIRSFAYGILQRSTRWSNSDRLEVCRYFTRTIERNIESFLRNKHKMAFSLSDARDQFPIFWEKIGAKGDLAAALKEFEIRHNARRKRGPFKSLLRRIYGVIH